ncbi:MAG TPA: serine/threonine-protein kinase [Polyangiaceae bacterium]
MSRTSAIPQNSAEATRDLQDRLGRFARTTCVISLVMLVAYVVNAHLEGPGGAPISAPSRVLHLLATVLLIGVWRLTRGKNLALRTIEALDAALTIVLCTLWAGFGIGVSPQEPIEFSVILATTYTLIARSVVVPSSFARTLVISSVSVLPTLYFFVTRGMGFVHGAPAAQIRTFLMFAALWCGVAVVTAALQSRLLFGLRARIREASQLGQYTLEEKLGAGGMGVVYRASHAMLRRPAAIKLLLPERTGDAHLARFEREVQLTSRLRHPNTISIFDYGRSADGTFYYVMEYLDGFDLEWLVEAIGPLEPARVIRILGQASGALAEAHDLGLIHRDIKPANLILTERADEADIVKVVDFGLVKTQKHDADDLTVTHTNVITGTPLYLAPEAISTPGDIDGRSDLYALGAVAYYLLTGTPVFEGKTVIEICSKHMLEAPVPPSERLGRPLPEDLEKLVLACLAKSPSDRPATAAALREALTACARTSPYDDRAARTWWENNASALRARRKGSVHPELKLTMAINLQNRPNAA